VIKTLLAGLVVVLSFCPTASAWADDTTPTLDQVAAVYGARMPAAIRVTGSIISFRRGEGQLLRLFKSPDRFRNEVTYASGAEIRTMVGPLAWNQSKPANPALRSAIALQAARVALPWNLLEKRSSVIDMGRSEVDGKTIQELEFPLEPTLKMLIQVDTESGHIVQSRGIMLVGERTMEFTTRYSEFRSVAGRTWASHEEQYAMDQHIGHSRIDNVEYLDSLPDSAFAPWTSVLNDPATDDLSHHSAFALR